MATVIKTPITKTIKKRVSVMPSFRRGTIDDEIKKWDSAAQTPKEKRGRRDRRFHMLRNKPS